MKIAIVTQPLENNIGGDLQNWALQQVLISMGHDPLTIDYHGVYPRPKLRLYLSIIKHNVYALGKKLLRRPARFAIFPSHTPRRHRKRFYESHYKLSAPTHVYSELPGIDAYITGSDQVWRPCYNASLSAMFLDFVSDEKPKIAYAASFGVDSWEFNPQQKQQCACAAKRLNAISVREDGAISLCNEHLGVEAVKVLDPTLLLDASDYMTLCGRISRRRRPLIHAYILDPTAETYAAINIAKKALKLPVFESHTVITPDAKWLAAFRDAAFIVTDSFHGCVFSIIFRKPFAVIGNKARGLARFLSLLENFGLESRLCTSAAEIGSLINKPIDWTAAEAKLAQQKQQSIKFLREALS